MRTDDLIRRLAADLPESGRQASRRGIGLGGAAAGSAMLTLPLCLALYGLRTNGPAEDAVGLLLWAGLGVAALSSARWLSRPEPSPMIALYGPLAVLIAAVAVMAWLGQRDGVTVFRADHVLHCAKIIGMLAVAPFLCMTFAMRRGAPASPRAAGAMIGLMAGAIAAFAYTLSCPIDDTLAALSAHAVSVVLISAVGAALGPALYSW